MSVIKKQDDFQAMVLESTKPVLVFYYANWCEVCKMISPLIQQIVKEKAGVMNVVYMDVDKFEELADKYEVSCYPYFILFKEGQIIDRMQSGNKNKIFEFVAQV